MDYPFTELKMLYEKSGKEQSPLFPFLNYAAMCGLKKDGTAVDDYDECKQKGIEVYLDVVFNHTAEGNEMGPFFSFKGFDNNIYYLLNLMQRARQAIIEGRYGAFVSDWMNSPAAVDY